MEDAFLLRRNEATRRYGISMRELEGLYKRDKEFPIVRIGKTVRIIRDEADRYFRERRGENVKG